MAASTPISDRVAGETLRDVSSPVESKSPSGAAQNDLWIFRDGKRMVSGPELVNDLRRRIAACTRDRAGVLDALIQAGELETALADAGCATATVSARVTDVLAEALCTGNLASLEPGASLLDNLDATGRTDAVTHAARLGVIDL